MIGGFNLLRLSPPVPRPVPPVAQTSPEALARAFAIMLVRRFGEDASRLIDISVAQVQDEIRGGGHRPAPPADH